MDFRTVVELEAHHAVIFRTGKHVPALGIKVTRRERPVVHEILDDVRLLKVCFHRVTSTIP